MPSPWLEALRTAPALRPLTQSCVTSRAEQMTVAIARPPVPTRIVKPGQCKKPTGRFVYMRVDIIMPI